MPRVVTTVIVGAGVMMIGEVDVAALSTRGRVFEAMTGGTELYRVTNTFTVGNMFIFSFICKVFLLCKYLLSPPLTGSQSPHHPPSNRAVLKTQYEPT